MPCRITDRIVICEAISIFYNPCQIDGKVVEGVEFIIKHLQGVLFPRKIMTKKIGYQIEVSDMDSLLRYYRESDYLDCRINAYPVFTGYKGTNMTPPGFIMIDLDLRLWQCKN
jgi:hypothetical protein